MEKYQVTLIGVSPLLFNRDNYKWQERVKEWTTDPANKSASQSGDCRTPAWTWIGCCYFANGKMVIDSDNLMAMLRDAGKKCPTGKGKATFKAATQSGVIVNEIGWPVLVPKGEINQTDIEALVDDLDFSRHMKVAESLGFELFVKRATIGTKKHIRVRPRFDQWTASGTITVLDESLDEATLNNIFAQGGRFVGIGDWRPGSPASGRFGMFSHELRRI